MNKKIFIVSAAIAVLVGAFVANKWFKTATDEHARHTPSVEDKDRVHDTGDPGASQDVRIEKQEVIPFEKKSIGMLKGRYVGLPRGQSLPFSLKNRVYAAPIFHDRVTDTVVRPDFHAPLDSPKVEFRFYEPTMGGGRKPCQIERLFLYPIVSGRAHRVSDVKNELTRIQLFTEPGVKTASRMRCLLSKPADELEYRSLIKGRTYYAHMLREGWEERRAPNEGAALVTIPREVEEGEVAVIKLDATGAVTKYRRPGSSEGLQWEEVTIKVEESYLKPGMAVALSDPVIKKPRAKQLDKKGTVTIKVRELGGDLGLAYYDDTRGYCIAHKQSVTGKNVVLPGDADLLADPDDVITFDLKLSSVQIPDGTVGIGLAVNRDDYVPMGFCQFPPKGIPDSVRIPCVPGNYYVKLPRAETPIGRVELKRTDAGKTLEILPLRE